MRPWRSRAENVKAVSQLGACPLCFRHFQGPHPSIRLRSFQASEPVKEQCDKPRTPFTRSMHVLCLRLSTAAPGLSLSLPNSPSMKLDPHRHARHVSLTVQHHEPE